MSSELGIGFGQEYGEEYGKVVAKWGKRLKGVKRISDEIKKEWSVDLRKALESQLVEVIVKKTSPGWKKVGELPSDETIKRFAQTAAKGSLEQDTNDLLERLRLMAQEPESEEAITAAITVSEALKRVGQTVSQIFDMVKDRFNGTMERYNRRQGKLTGRRRWQTNSLKSRHSRLDGQVKSEDERFVYKGESVYGPRPPGGSPANWSNCSCSLDVQRRDGDWVSI